MSSLVLICTNDLHSCADQYAALRREMDAITRDSAAPVLKVDAGDWYSGTIYSWLGPQSSCSACPEVEFFLENNIVANIGNHEFDATVRGLANMLEKASRLGYRKFVCSNIRLKDDCILNKYYSKDIHAPNVLNECVVEAVHGFGNVGILGLMGPDAAFGCKATTVADGVSFSNLKQALNKCRHLAKQLREKSACKAIVVLIHGGKEELDGIDIKDIADFVVCGHTNEIYKASSARLATQAGYSGKFLGVHYLRQSGARGLQVATSQVFTISMNQQRHSAYSEHIPKYLSELNVRGIEIPLNTLPHAARIPIARQVNCPFATWVCDGLLTEIRLLFNMEVDGFFLAHELIRGDLVGAARDGRVSVADVASMLECGLSNPEKIGIGIQIIETTPRQLLSLHSLLWLGSKFLTANALPAYSSKFFSTVSFANLISGRTVRIATTKFLVDSLVAVPSQLFDSSSIVGTRSSSLSILLFKYMMRVTNAKL